MKRISKFSIIILVIVTLLTGAFIGIMNASVPLVIREELNKQVYRLTGSSLSINSEMQWSFFPLGITAHKLVLSNPPEFGPTPLATAEEVRFSVNVLPLFSHKVEIKKILVKEINLQLIKTISGKENWKRFLNLINAKTPIKPEKNSRHAVITEKPLWILNITGDLIYNRKNDEFSIPTFGVKINKTFFEGNLTGTLNPTLSAKGEIHSQTLQIGNLIFKDLHSSVDVQGSLISLSALKAKLNEGDYTGNILINMHREPPVVTLSGKLTNANVASFFKDMISNIPFSGKMNATTQLSFVVGEGKYLQKTLNGNLHIDVTDGVLRGVNIPALIELGQALLQQKTIPNFAHVNQTDFGVLKGSFLIRNGIMTNQDLSLLSTQLEATGHGKINLVEESIDYFIQAGLVGHKTRIPIHIQGNFNKPSINVPSVQVNREVLTESINKLKEKLNNRLKKFNLAL